MLITYLFIVGLLLCILFFIKRARLPGDLKDQELPESFYEKLPIAEYTNALTNKALREQLAAYGLPTYGKKSELVTRLLRCAAYIEDYKNGS